jgi:hypothetical protein
MKLRVVKLLRAADERPVASLLLFAGVLYAALLGWARFSSAPVLLGRLDGEARLAVYGQLANTAVALLAVSLTVLAILVALPDREAVIELREGPAWPLIQAFLLGTAFLCLVTLVTAHLGTALDAGDDGREWLGLLVVTSAVMSVVSVFASGIAFGLFLRRAGEPADPSVGRGSGGA